MAATYETDGGTSSMAELDHRSPASTESPLPLVAQYGVAVALVAAATALAFGARAIVAAPNLSLIYVLPVVVAGASLSLGPSVVTVILGVMSFDFFFTQPYLTLRISDPSEIWAAALLFVIAAIVSVVAGTSRRRALAAQRAAVQAQALHRLAHAIIEERPHQAVLQEASNALSQIFAAPSVILLQAGGKVQVEATTGDVTLSPAAKDAACSALERNAHVRGGIFPYDRSSFDFWPLSSAGDRHYVMGVNFEDADLERPADADRFVDMVGAYISSIGRAQKGDGD